MRLSKFGFLIQEGFKSIFTHGFMSFASVTIMVACLLIMGSFSLVAVNIDALIDKVESQNEVLAFVDETISEDDARALQSRINAINNVVSCEFVTREQAMNDYADQFDKPDLFVDIDSSVFRDRYVIYLNDIGLMEQTKGELEQIDGIAKVNAEIAISDGIVKVRNIVSAISMVLAIILVVVSVFIMANTVKLTTFGRREEIAIMKMVGASNGFIRFPFIVEGLVLGLLGAIIAFFAQWGLYTVVCNSIMKSVVGYIVGVIAFKTLYVPVLLVYLAVGAAVGTFGGVIAIRNYLKV